MDTIILCTTKPLDIFLDDFGDNNMNRVDLVVWDKMRMGMGARSRHQCEFLMTFQKNPKRAKGIWKRHDIRDVWSEAITKTHPHTKPHKLHAAMIECLTNPGDVVVNPTAGGFSTLDAGRKAGRRVGRAIPSNRPRSLMAEISRGGWNRRRCVGHSLTFEMGPETDIY
jgi:DNA modification methylase